MEPGVYVVLTILAVCLLAAIVAVFRRIINGRIRTVPPSDSDDDFDRFCERQHVTSSDRPEIRINPDAIPPELRPLIPMAEKWGISDDLIRHNCIRSASPEEREELLGQANTHREVLTNWLKRTDVTKSQDAVAMAFMEVAASEMERR